MIEIRRATAADIPFTMETERLPGYEAFIGRSEAAEHLARLDDPRHAHFIAWENARPAGFAILRHWNAADGITLLMRTAVAEPGRGHGKAFLRGLIGLVFTETNCIVSGSVSIWTTHGRATFTKRLASWPRASRAATCSSTAGTTTS